MGTFVFLVRKEPKGWIVQGAVWQSRPMGRLEALTLAQGMAAAAGRTGIAADVIVQDPANDLADRAS